MHLETQGYGISIIDIKRKESLRFSDLPTQNYTKNTQQTNTHRTYTSTTHLEKENTMIIAFKTKHQTNQNRQSVSCTKHKPNFVRGFQCTNVHECERSNVRVRRSKWSERRVTPTSYLDFKKKKTHSEPFWRQKRKKNITRTSLLMIFITRSFPKFRSRKFHNKNPRTPNNWWRRERDVKWRWNSKAKGLNSRKWKTKLNSNQRWYITNSNCNKIYIFEYVVNF